jgi:hypothetical protein
MIPWQCPRCGSTSIQHGSDGCNQPMQTWCLDCGKLASKAVFRKEYVKNHLTVLQDCMKCHLYCSEYKKLPKLVHDLSPLSH